MNRFHITEIIKKKNRINYCYVVEGEWEKYFDQDILFWSEYDCNIENIPNSVAVLPLIGNIIVMASIFDAVIYVNEIDKDFYDSIEAFLEGYQLISPHISFKKRNLVVTKQIIHNSDENKELRNMVFFSGGVDAWSSLITHMEENPSMISIWGADIPFENEKAWEHAEATNREITDTLKLEFLTIRSSLRRFINEKELNEYSMEKVKDNWWSAFQHSVGMMCLATPYIQGNLTHLYFASTYSVKDKKGDYVIASDPLIDNHVAFAGCNVLHDGYEYSRHDKVVRVCEFAKKIGKPIKIRVCFQSSTGDNCCKCEKCSNTIMSILTEGYKPEDYGFPYDKDKFPVYFTAGLQEMAKEEKYSFLSIYTHLQSALRKKYDLNDIPKEMKLFYTSDMDYLADFLNVPCNSCLAKEEKNKYCDEVVNGKAWIEEQYFILKDKLKLVEDDWSLKNDWIAKLEKDILWLKEENTILSLENEKLCKIKKISFIRFFFWRLRQLIKI